MSRLIAFIFILTLSPVLLCLMVPYLFLSDGGPFFASWRMGLNEERFRLFKFRTLKSDTTKSISDREFKYGTFLRKSSLDELPQLWNILMGEMSFVGPRPLPIEYQKYLSEKQKLRHQVRPGLTGWAQVNGRTNIDWGQKMELDLEYLKKRSFLFDSIIILKTVWVVLLQKDTDSLQEESMISWVKRTKNSTLGTRHQNNGDTINVTEHAN